LKKTVHLASSPQSIYSIDEIELYGLKSGRRTASNYMMLACCIMTQHAAGKCLLYVFAPPLPEGIFLKSTVTGPSLRLEAFVKDDLDYKIGYLTAFIRYIITTALSLLLSSLTFPFLFIFLSPPVSFPGHFHLAFCSSTLYRY
jgi:hypothetical protein